MIMFNNNNKNVRMYSSNVDNINNNNDVRIFNDYMIINSNPRKRDRNDDDDDEDMNMVDNDNENDNVILLKRGLYENNLHNDYYNYLNNNDYKGSHIYGNNNMDNSSMKYYNDHDQIEYDHSGDGYKYNHDNNNNENINSNDDNKIVEMKDNDIMNNNNIDDNNNHNNITNDDDLISIVGFKSPRYRRKVDYLVDEIIKKCTRLNVRHNSIGGAINRDHMSDIPDSIGPHPLTSHLSVILPSHELNNMYDNDDENISNSNINCNNNRDFPKHSGNITHTEWFIEELSGAEGTVNERQNRRGEQQFYSMMNMGDDSSSDIE